MSPRLRRLLHRRVLVSLGAALAAALAVASVTAHRGARPYTPGEAVEGITDVRRKRPAADAGVLFGDVAAKAGVAFRHFAGGTRSTQLPEDMGSGCAWGDYDGDGDWDLFVADFTGPVTTSADAKAAGPGGSRLFRNEGGGRFADVTREAGLALAGSFLGAAWGDYDGDGRPDLFVTAYGTNRLFRNEGNGTFTDVSGPAGVGGARGPSGFWTGAAWGDYDHDGRLDLYVCGYVEYTREPAGAARSSSFRGIETPFTINPSSYAPARNLLYHNEGNGRFRELAAELGVANAEGRSLSATFADLDGDGWPDLYVANDVSEGALFVNTRDGLFADRGHEAHVADYRGSMGIAVADVDGDGAQDLFVTHWIAEGNALYLGKRLRSSPPRLDFEDAAERLGLGVAATADDISWGTGFLDVDNDGRPDLMVATGSTFQDGADPRKLAGMRSRLFWNRGERGFVDIADAAVPAFAQPRVARGLAIADYDGDGREDAAVVVNGGDLLLLRNEKAPDNAWITVRVKGTRSNTMGLGARVLVRAGGARQAREIGAGSSYLSQHAPEAHFGLGAAETVDELAIAWPSGLAESHRNVPARRIYVAVEGTGRLEELRTARAPSTRALSREQTLAFWSAHRRAAAAAARGDSAAAVAAYGEALRVDPAHEDSLYGLGNALFDRGEVAGAASAFERLIAVNPRSARAHAALGDLLADPASGTLFDRARARTEYEAASRVNAEETGWVVRLAELALASGDDGRARELLGHVARTNPRSFQSPYLLGWMAWKARAHAESAALFQSSLQALGPQVSPAPGEGDVRRAAVPLPDRGVLREHWRALRRDGVVRREAAYRDLDRVLAALRERR